MLLAVSSCFCPLISFFFLFLSFFFLFSPVIFLPFSPEALVPRMGAEIREKEGHGNKEPQKKNMLACGLCQYWQIPQPLEISHIPSSPCFSTFKSSTPSWELGQSPLLLLMRVCQSRTQKIVNSKKAPTPTS